MVINGNVIPEDTVITCSVTINRAAPDSIDPMYSNRGHERSVNFPNWKHTTMAEVNAWIAQNAPEVNRGQAHTNVCTAGESFTYTDRAGVEHTAYDNRHYYFLVGKDARGYSTSVYVQATYPQHLVEPK